MAENSMIGLNMLFSAMLETDNFERELKSHPHLADLLRILLYLPDVQTIAQLADSSVLSLEEFKAAFRRFKETGVLTVSESNHVGLKVELRDSLKKILTRHENAMLKSRAEHSKVDIPSRLRRIEEMAELIQNAKRSRDEAQRKL